MGYWTPGHELRAAAVTSALTVRDRWPAGADDDDECERRIDACVADGATDVVVRGGRRAHDGGAGPRRWTEVADPGDGAEALLAGARALVTDVAGGDDLLAVAELGRLATSAGAMLDVRLAAGAPRDLLGLAARVRAVLPAPARLTVRTTDVDDLPAVLARLGSDVTLRLPPGSSDELVVAARRAGARRFETDRAGVLAAATPEVVRWWTAAGAARAGAERSEGGGW